MPEKSIVEKVYRFLTHHNLFGKKFVLGFSGGFDSMCLLDILSKMDIRLVVAHFNHGWRIEADKEEVRCKEACEKRGVIFYTERAPKDLKKTETEARNARYEFFTKVAKKYNADGIFTAHNADDNAETVVYRIIKGTGIIGLQGISAKRENIYRPLIDCTREEIEEYCKINELIPNVDSSNFDIKYKRNFIRHEILPKMSEINKNAKLAINKLSELARLDNTIIEEYLAMVSQNIVSENRLITNKFMTLSQPVKQRLLYSFLTNYLKEYDLKRIHEIMEFIELNTNSRCMVKISLTNGLWLGVNNHYITVFEETFAMDEPVIITGNGEYEFVGGKLIVEECTQKPKIFPPDSDGVGYVDFSKVKFPLELRYGVATDEFSPIGMSGKMLFKKFLSGRKIEQHLRKTMVIVAKLGKILWVPKMGTSESVKVNEITTHKLTWKEKA